jgi:uncharacterized membrane protein YccC
MIGHRLLMLDLLTAVAPSRVARHVKDAAAVAGPPLLFGVRLWASVCIALYLAFWLQLDNAVWAPTTAALVCQPQLGASLRKAWFLMIGTLVGAVATVVMIACFPQNRAGFLILLALWCALCCLISTVLRNFAAYSAALAGYTAAIIVGGLIDGSGGVNANAAFLLAVTRATEIGIGIVSAAIILAGTDLGSAPRRLAGLLADLSGQIAARFTAMLASTEPDLHAISTVRRNMILRVIALDPMVDEVLGESPQLRYYSAVLQRAVAGMFIALAGWRAVANHLGRMTSGGLRQQSAVLLQRLPSELLPLLTQGEPAGWRADPTGLRPICEAGVRRLIALPVGTPSARLLADKAAVLLAGITHTLDGLALLMIAPARPVLDLGGRRLHVPDWLPALVNAGRAFLAIGAVALLWIVTAWPDGATAISFAAIGVILFAPFGDEAYAATLGFMVGIILAAVFAAIIAFAALPGFGTETFAGFAIVIGIYVVSVGAMVSTQWQRAVFVAMTAYFFTLLQPANQQIYDPQQFYNKALAIVFGFGVAALSFRLLPPLSPAFRACRLLALSLRDVRRLAMGRAYADWERQVHARLSAMPRQASPLQAAQLLAALSVGSEIIQLGDIARWLDRGLHGGSSLSLGLGPVLAAVAEGNSAKAITSLARLDQELAADAVGGAGTQTILRARASILALSELLTEHAAYFNAAAFG